MTATEKRNIVFSAKHGSGFGIWFLFIRGRLMVDYTLSKEFKQ